MYDLFILTTAIDRPDLHNKSLKPFFEDLNKQGIKYLWIVNLDSVFKRVDEALLNFESFIVENKIIRSSKNPCFFNAASYLMGTARSRFEDLKEEGKILWLEDDWDYNIKFNVKEIINTDYEYIGFHFHHLFEFSLNPSMWSKDFFLNNVYFPFIINKGKKDPEKLLIDYHKKQKEIDPNHFKSVKKISFGGVFKDLGRTWMNKNDHSKKKWKKNQEENSITYS